MDLKDLLPIVVAVIVPIISGVLSFLAATKKSQADLLHLQEQNKLEIDRLVNQHKFDLDGLEVKHKQEIEKLELEHKHKIELMQKEMENQIGGGLVNSLGSGMINELMRMPEMKNQLRQSFAKNKGNRH